ncbi:MAG: hypothetical protein CM15mP82_7530 [Methanobacteriota archaeon]|nr:MAG: hypothetical protein CM15mP82_7530 [Euryarchaeota archaeon]
MTVLFMVVLIDMIGFTLVIPFLTYFIQDLAAGDGFTDVGARDRWVGIVLASYTLGQFLLLHSSELSLTPMADDQS